MNKPVLTVSHLSRTFLTGSRPVPAVCDVSLTVGSRESVGLVGESGCGKSTLARLITRLDSPDAGTVTLCGQDITRLSGASLRRAYRDIKMIFQEPRASFDPRLTLGTSIRVALHAAGFPRAKQTEETAHLLREVGLESSYADAQPGDVSGGECQRAAIARAVATRPRLLVCDEATSALDVSVQAQIMELLRTLGQTHGMSFLFISHDLALVSSFCTRLYVMRGGKIVEHGATGHVIRAPRNPYTRELISSVLPVC
ncbi:MAG: ABC transporter ATP-binding protein [Intestinimonas sp.]|jgi:peptide/nickel transport system ATP-binding protein|nr:ABC transporter ATP-binding protein [Intestinimonas sp.]